MNKCLLTMPIYRRSTSLSTIIVCSIFLFVLFITKNYFIKENDYFVPPTRSKFLTYNHNNAIKVIKYIIIKKLLNFLNFL